MIYSIHTIFRMIVKIRKLTWRYLKDNGIKSLIIMSYKFSIIQYKKFCVTFIWQINLIYWKWINFLIIKLNWNIINWVHLQTVGFHYLLSKLVGSSTLHVVWFYYIVFSFLVTYILQWWLFIYWQMTLQTFS